MFPSEQQHIFIPLNYNIGHSVFLPPMKTSAAWLGSLAGLLMSVAVDKYAFNYGPRSPPLCRSD
jgi:hypothetical protein